MSSLCGSAEATRERFRAFAAHSLLACRPLRPRGVQSSTVPDSDVDMAFAESRPARHSQSSRNPFRAGDDFRGFLVHTFATACQIACPPDGSDHLRGQRGLLLPGFQRNGPVAGYNYSSDWTPLLTGLSPARMAASLAAPTPSPWWTLTTYFLPVSRRTRT
jgi:hypothetical protein